MLFLELIMIIMTIVKPKLLGIKILFSVWETWLAIQRNDMALSGHILN